jgi:hypothetical protein
MISGWPACVNGLGAKTLFKVSVERARVRPMLLAETPPSLQLGLDRRDGQLAADHGARVEVVQPRTFA